MDPYVRHRYWSERRTLNSRQAAIAELECGVGWRSYGGKHHESIYTRFFQSYILPKKFGFDKRRAHLANQVLAGVIGREQALAEMQKPPYETPELEQEGRRYVVKKLGLTDEQFEEIMRTPPRRYEDFPNMYNSANFLAARQAFRATRTAAPRIGRALRSEGGL